MQKTKFKIIVLLCIITCLLSACSTSSSPEKPVPSNDNEQVEIEQEPSETDMSTDVSTNTENIGGVWTGVHIK